MCEINFWSEKTGFPPKIVIFLLFYFFCKIHFDQKYFFKIYFNLKCNFILFSKL